MVFKFSRSVYFAATEKWAKEAVVEPKRKARPATFCLAPASCSRNRMHGRVEQKLVFEICAIAGLLAFEWLQPCRERLVPLCG